MVNIRKKFLSEIMAYIVIFENCSIHILKENKPNTMMPSIWWDWKSTVSSYNLLNCELDCEKINSLEKASTIQSVLARTVYCLMQLFSANLR